MGVFNKSEMDWFSKGEAICFRIYDDADAYRIWTEVCKVDPSHILKTDDNFLGDWRRSGRTGQ